MPPKTAGETRKERRRSRTARERPVFFAVSLYPSHRTVPAEGEYGTLHGYYLKMGRYDNDEPASIEEDEVGDYSAMSDMILPISSRNGMKECTAARFSA